MTSEIQRRVTGLAKDILRTGEMSAKAFYMLEHERGIEQAFPLTCNMCMQPFRDGWVSPFIADIWCMQCAIQEIFETTEGAVLFAMKKVKITGILPERSVFRSDEGYQETCFQSCTNYQALLSKFNSVERIRVRDGLDASIYTSAIRKQLVYLLKQAGMEGGSIVC